MSMWIVVQEGGSSSEIYVSAHETLEQARAFRQECAKGAYRTSIPFETLLGPSDLLFELLDNVAAACINVEYPE